MIDGNIQVVDVDVNQISFITNFFSRRDVCILVKILENKKILREFEIEGMEIRPKTEKKKYDLVVEFEKDFPKKVMDYFERNVDLQADYDEQLLTLVEGIGKVYGREVKTKPKIPFIKLVSRKLAKILSKFILDGYYIFYIADKDKLLFSVVMRIRDKKLDFLSTLKNKEEIKRYKNSGRTFSFQLPLRLLTIFGQK